ncbi:MAG: hypothetical protein ACXADY_06615 [Candidatus Hodarchaeales archaeon]|jgi:subtilisin-like proprotein convertase family protein
MSNLINFKNYKMIFCVFMVLLCAPIVNFSNNGVEIVNSTLSRTDRMDSSPALKIGSNGGPYIGTPSITPIDPGSDESVTVTALISDPDGIKNATLSWQYTYNSSILFNTSLTDIKQPIVEAVDEKFDEVVVGAGDYGAVDGDRTYGNYTYEAGQDEVIIEIDFNVTTIKEANNLTYVLIKSKNLTTGNWEIEQEKGAPMGTTDLEFDKYYSTKAVTGYQIYAISYKDGPPQTGPTFEYLNIYKKEEENITANWVIPAANNPTFVTYNIKAFDILNNSATSDTNTFLMDWEPEVTLHNLPQAIQPNQNLILNVSVLDLDGVATINDSSVVAYYRLVGEMEWNSVNLDKHGDNFIDTSFYEGTFPTGTLENLETDIEIMVNASDIVEGQKGRTGSVIETTVLDSLNPRVTEITVQGGVTVPDLGNVTLATSEVNITAIFFDPAGISSVFIYYSIPNGTSPIKKEMINSTLKEPEEQSVTFFVTLPAANETAVVEYFFETSDYFSNTGTTSVNHYYADASGPVLNNITSYPLIISNITDVTILFNASDYSGIDPEQSEVWYSFDEGYTWTNTDISEIDYPKQVDYEKIFSAKDLEIVPFLIKDNGTSTLSMEIVRGGQVDSAQLIVGFTHELSTDLRIWLTLGDDRRLLVFDREPGPAANSFIIDLFELGLTQSDFDNGNFTLEIQDYSVLYSGFITTLDIELKHHRIPLGYQFMAIINKTGIDTNVTYFLTLSDQIWNLQNTSTYQYYSDGLPPTINIQTIISPLDLSGGNSIQIVTNVTDTGGVLGVDIYYKFAESAEWSVASMVFDPQTNMYLFDIPIPTTNGTLIYKIRAFDLSGLASETPIDIIEFFNGRPGTSKGADLWPLIILGGILLIIGAGGTGAVYLIRKRSLSESTELVETLESTEIVED